MAKRKAQDSDITGIQKLITFALIGFMGYIFFTQDKIRLPEQPEPVKVIIRNTNTGSVSQSDLRAGKILIGKWEIELAAEVAAQPAPAAPQTSEAIDANEGRIDVKESLDNQN